MFFFYLGKLFGEFKCFVKKRLQHKKFFFRNFSEYHFYRTPPVTVYVLRVLYRIKLAKYKEKLLNIASLRSREELCVNEQIIQNEKSFAKVCNTVNRTLDIVFPINTCALILHPKLHPTFSLLNHFPFYLFHCLIHGVLKKYHQHC